jgi:hypothetical protein
LFLPWLPGDDGNDVVEIACRGNSFSAVCLQGSVAVNSRSIAKAELDDGDSIRVGGKNLMFALPSKQPAAGGLLIDGEQYPLVEPSTVVEGVDPRVPPCLRSAQGRPLSAGLGGVGRAEFYRKGKKFWLRCLDNQVSLNGGGWQSAGTEVPLAAKDTLSVGRSTMAFYAGKAKPAGGSFEPMAAGVGGVLA